MRRPAPTRPRVTLSSSTHTIDEGVGRIHHAQLTAYEREQDKLAAQADHDNLPPCCRGPVGRAADQNPPTDLPPADTPCFPFDIDWLAQSRRSAA